MTSKLLDHHTGLSQSLDQEAEKLLAVVAADLNPKDKHTRDHSQENLHAPNVNIALQHRPACDGKLAERICRGLADVQCSNRACHTPG